MASTKTLAISEYFHSIQGEGKTSGHNAIFLRFTACNLICGGRGTIKDGKLHNGALWRCDSIEVWKTGKRYKVDELIDLLEKELDLTEKMLNGTHLILTGGEPMLQQDSLALFIRTLYDKTPSLVFSSHIEVETNGTILPTEEFSQLVDTWNVSVKLENSGETESRRIKPEVINYLNLRKGSIYKFVVSDYISILEIIALVKEHHIPQHKIWLMPSCETREELQQMQYDVVKFCLQLGFNYSNRMQIQIWDKTTGV